MFRRLPFCSLNKEIFERSIFRELGLKKNHNLQGTTSKSDRTTSPTPEEGSEPLLVRRFRNDPAFMSDGPRFSDSRKFGSEAAASSPLTETLCIPVRISPTDRIQVGVEFAMTGGVDSGVLAEDKLRQRIESNLHTEEMELIIGRCEEQCKALLDLVDEDILAVPHEQTTETAGSKSTVGIMVKETTVDELLSGGPAHMSKDFQRGDVILEVDGQPATSHNIIDLLVGEDVPGSLIQLRTKRGDEELQRTLIRAATAELADKKAMFALFTKIKDLARRKSDKQTTQAVESIIDLWSAMQEAEQRYDDKIVTNVRALQASADEAVAAVTCNKAPVLNRRRIPIN